MSTAVFIVVASRPEDMTELGPMLDAHPKVQARIRAYADPYLLGDGLANAPSSERVAAFRAACDRAAGHSPAEAWGNLVTGHDVRALADAPDHPEAAVVFVEALTHAEIILVAADGPDESAADVLDGDDDSDDGDDLLRDRRFVEELRSEITARGGLVLDPTASTPASIVDEICDHLGVGRPEPAVSSEAE